MSWKPTTAIRHSMIRRQVRVRLRVFWRRTKRFLVHEVLHADDPPHRLALGAAIGMFVAFTPTVGFQMVLSVFLSWILRANKLIGAPIVWISNPATLVPLYYACYRVGRTILQQQPLPAEWWTELRNPPNGWFACVGFYWSRFLEIAEPLWIGGFFIGLLLAYPTYYLVYYVVRGYRLRRWGQEVRPGVS